MYRLLRKTPPFRQKQPIFLKVCYEELLEAACVCQCFAVLQPCVQLLWPDGPNQTHRMHKSSMVMATLDRSKPTIKS
jgi:hypothetical protein